MGDDLAIIGSMETKLVIEDPDFLVWIGGQDSEVDSGVGVIDLGLFEGKVGIFWVEDEPNKEYERGDCQEECE